MILAETLAFDRSSVRTFDKDGHLRVATANISKANVCPYLGREIPEWQKLGLAADKTYKLLRDPKELEKAAGSFAGKPLLMNHKPVSAEDHDHDMVVGAVDGPAFSAPYLTAALSVWDGEAIKAIERGAAKELSCAYRYVADMTPGTHDGAAYDGVMRNIECNHVALVEKGRAGPDVVVGDSALKQKDTQHMAKNALWAQGVLKAALKPILAQDAQIDLDPALKGVTRKNLKAKTPAIVAGVKDAIKGKLAQDADENDTAVIQEVLGALADIPIEDVVASMDPANADPTKDPAEDDAGEAKTFLKSKGLSDDEIVKVMSMMSDDGETAEDRAKKVKAAADKAAAEKTKGMVTKQAMDAALASTAKSAREDAIKDQQSIREAERFVRPWVGELAMAHDSADAVFRTALTTLGVNVEGKHPDALRDILEARPKPGDKPAPRQTLAQDAAAAKGFADRYPDAARIKLG